MAPEPAASAGRGRARPSARCGGEMPVRLRRRVSSSPVPLLLIGCVSVPRRPRTMASAGSQASGTASPTATGSAKKLASATMAVKSSMPAPSTESFTEAPWYSMFDTMPVKPRPGGGLADAHVVGADGDVDRRAGSGAAPAAASCRRRHVERASRRSLPMRGRDDVVVAHEARDERRARRVRRPRAAWPPARCVPSFITTIEVGERHRLFLAVGDVDEGDAELASAASSARRACGSCRNGSSAESGSSSSSASRIGDQRAGQRHALLLAAGELRRQARRHRPPSARA